MPGRKPIKIHGANQGDIIGVILAICHCLDGNDVANFSDYVDFEQPSTDTSTWTAKDLEKA
jgi:hypothetical protein